MAAKEVKFHDSARNRIVVGVNILADAVKIVPGGGVALLRARQGIANPKGANHDQDAGIKIVMRALEEPLRQIVANTGDEPSVVLAKVLDGKGSYGWNAATGEYGDLVQMGVIDPTKVTRSRMRLRSPG
jgi:chaperonin GroEL